MTTYPAKITVQENNRFLIKFLDFNDIFTEGDTLEEALSNAREVLEAMLKFKSDNKIEIPPPSNIYNISVF